MNDDAVPPELVETLRRSRAELRDAQEEEEAEAEQLALKQRDLADVVLEAMYRGEAVRIAVGRHNFTGEVTHVGKKVAILRDRSGTNVHVSLITLTECRVLERRSEGRALRSTMPESLKDCLEELEATGDEAEVGGPSIDPLPGRVVVVARDHIVVRGRDRAERVLPLAAVGFVIRR